MADAKPRKCSNSSIDDAIVELGACGQLHLPTGRTCVREARHRNGCEFVPRDHAPERVAALTASIPLSQQGRVPRY